MTSTISTINNRNIRSLFLAVSVFSFMLQVFSFPTSINIVSSSIVLISSIIAAVYIFNVKTLLIYPISSLMILGYSLYYFFFPPIATLLEHKPVINNLILPVTTVLHSSIGLLTLIISHILYQKLFIFVKLKSILRLLYTKFGIYDPLNFSQLLTISLITLLSQCLSILFKSSNSESFFIKFLDGINYFIFLPYILIAPKLIKIKAKKTEKEKLFLICFSLTILVIGMIVNGRSFIFIGYANLLILYFYLSVYGKVLHKITRRNVIKLAALAVLFILLIGPATKLAISMALARSIRDDATPIEIVMETYYRYKSIDNLSEVIQNFEDLHFEQDTWDEHYVNNPFFARLCNLKYADNIFVINESLSSEDKELAKNQEIDKTYAILPLPILKLFKIQVNKEEVTSGSMGDYLFFLTGGIDKAEGSRTGSLIGTSFIVFGWLYPLFLAILTISVFIIGDSFIIFKDNILSFSPIAFLSFYPFLFFFTSSALGMESISGLLSFVLRGSIQMPIMYFLLLTITNRLVKLF